MATDVVLEEENKNNEDKLKKLDIFEKRWKYAVFPAMIAFVMLSAFGFYLIWGMLQHMQSMSADINRMTTLMEKSVPAIGEDISDINQTMSLSMPNIDVNVASMSQSTQSISASTRHIDRTTWQLNRSISKPIDMINNMMPFGIHPPTPARYNSF